MVGRRVAILVASALSFLSIHRAAVASEEVASGNAFFTVTQCRVMDTRISMGGPILAAGEKRVFAMAGSCGIPADARAVVVVITVVSPAAAGFAELFAGDATTPLTSLLNFKPGQVRASNGIAALAGDGSGTVALYNGSSGMADYVIDVSGYFKSACPAITVSPAGPALPAGTSGTPYNQTFTASGGTGPYTFVVTSGALPAGLNLASGGLLSGTPTVAGDFSFTVTATDTATGCTGSNAYTLHINCGTLTVNITPTPAQVCSGSAGNSASATAGFATYSWTITNGTIQGSTTGQTISYTAGASGNVGLTVNVTDASACPGQGITNVPINANPPPPSIATSNPQTFTVSGGAGTFTLTFNGQTTSSLAFNATAAQVQTALTALSSIGGVGGTAAVSQVANVYTVTFGGTLTGPQPQMTASGAGGATVVVSSPSVCADSTGNQARGPAGATSYAWTIGNGTITSAANIQTITYTAGSSGNVTLNLTITNPGGCSASNSVLVAITPAPSTPTITPTPAQVCGGSTGNTAAGPAGATTYAWTIGNGTITSATNIQTITYTAGASGNVTLNLTVTNASGCPASNSLLVPINTSPATPSITPTPAQVCANSTGNTASGPAGATSYAWTIGNGTITSATNIQTITYTAGAAGNVTLNLTVTNAADCAASNSALVPISANPAPPTVLNSGPQMVTVTGGAGTFTLTFNGQTTSSLAFNATAAQVQTALNALSSIAGVGGSVTVNLAGGVYSVLFGGTLTGPQPLMTASGSGGATVAVSPTACADSTGNQASGPAGATTYAWTITNGSITSATNVQTITYTAGSSGTVTLSLTVTNAATCSASNSLLVTINPTPAAPTITPTPAQVCANSTGNTADGPAGMASYAWTITNGTITSATNIQTITYTAGASGNVTLGLTVTNASNCSASNSLNVTINPAPATPTITPSPAQVCAGSTGNTASGPAGATTYAWSITNGTITSATNIQTITYTAGVAAGNVGLTLVVTNAQGCSASNTVNVTKNPTPAFTPAAGALSVATFNVAYSLTFVGTSGTAPYTFVLASGALPTGMTLNSNGTVSPNTPSVTGPFAFSITVTDANSCSSTQAYTLNVQPNLQPDAYSGVGNTQLFITGVAGAPTTPAVSSATDVLANDTPAGIAVTAGTTACGGIGGSITIDSVGRFIFTPAVNTTGLATCTYTGTSNTIAATGAINITLTNKVWYVNNSTGSDSATRGRSHEPLLTIAQAVTNASANDYIFVHFTGANYAGASLSKDGLTLWGQGTTFSLGNLTITGTSKPTINSTLTIAGNTQTVSSLDISAGATTGITNTGTRTGLTIKNNIAVTTTTGRGVLFSNVDSTAGGAPNNGINFRSVTSNGAINGISLTSVNVANGSFTIAGDGTNAANGSGGTIQNSTGPGVLLMTATNVSLRSMNIQNGTDDGIHGESVNNLDLIGCNVTGNGNSTSDDGLQLGLESGATVGITGTLNITNSSISGNAHNGVHIRNTSGTLAAMNVTGSTFSNVNDTFGANAFLFEMSVSATNTASTISGSTFANNSPQRALEVQAHDTATITLFTVSGCTFNDNGIHTSFTQDGSSNLTFKMLNNLNMLNSNPLQAINVFSSSTSTGGTLTGTIQGNTIGNAGIAGSGSTAGSGIRILIQGRTVGKFLIDNNTIRQVGFTSGSRGMDLQFLGSLTTGLGIVSVNDITITNNTVITDAPASTFPLGSIFLGADNQGSPAQVRADIRSNTVPASGTYDYPSFDGNGAQLQYVNVTAGAVAELVKHGSPANAQAEMIASNPGSPAARVYANGVNLITGPITTPP